MKKKTYEYLTFYSPSFVYIPYDNIENLSIRKDKKIYNNSIIGTRKDNSNIFSDVSGVLAGSMKMNYLSGHSEALIIENDFMDRKKVLNPYKDISSLNKNEINDLLIKHGLYKRLNSKSTLIVNSTYNSKNDIGDMFINYESYDEILETIDEILNVYNIKVCYIVVPREDFVSIDAYNKYINAFDNICIVHSNKKFNDGNDSFEKVNSFGFFESGNKFIAGSYSFDGGANGDLPALRIITKNITFPVTAVISADGYEDLKLNIKTKVFI